MLIRLTHRDPLRKHHPDVHVRDAGVDVHPDGLPILHKYLFEEHPGDFARLHKCVGHKVAIGSVCAAPTCSEAFFFDCARLNENIARSWYFGLYSSSESLRENRE